MYKNNTIGVVVPAYNEEKLIEETLGGIFNCKVDIDKIYVVDDKSTDKTSEKIKKFKEEDDKSNKIHIISHERNGGVGAAIISGYKQALKDRIDIVVVMAGDHQMDPSQLPRMIEPIINGRADYTKGNRLLGREYRKGMSKWRLFGNSLLTLLTKIASGYWQIMDPQNGYSAISKNLLERLNLEGIYKRYGYCNDLLVKLNTLNAVVLDISMPARYGRERSGINYITYIHKVSYLLLKDFFLRLMMKYGVLSFHPLLGFYIFGIIMTPAGLILAFDVLWGKFISHTPVSQNFPLLAAFLLIIGIQFILFAMLFDMEMDPCKKKEATFGKNKDEF